MNQNQFALQKVKRNPNGGLYVEFQVEERDGNEIRWDDMKKGSSKIQHSDFNNVLDRMTSHVARCLNFSWIKTVMESSSLKTAEAKAFDQLEKIIEAGLKAAESNIVVNGITISGSDKKKQVIIMSTLTTGNKKKVAINTPLILLEADIFGFEQELVDDVDELVEETFAYLFKNKKAQLDIFDNAPADELPKEVSKLKAIKNTDNASTSRAFVN